MTNNDIIRRLRYVFGFNDDKMIAVFNLADHDVTKEEVAGWLKKDGDPLLVEITDRELAIFLNGLINEKRGKREGPQPEPENPLSNNMILRKLKIALNLRSEDIIDLFTLINKKISKHELSAFFRNSDHRHFRPFLDQYLRNFLSALQTKYSKAPNKN